MIAGQVHHGGNEPIKSIRAQEETGLAALLQAHDAAERLGQLVDRGLQQLQARVIFQRPEQGLIRVGTGVVTQAAAHHGDSLTHQGSLDGG